MPQLDLSNALAVRIADEDVLEIRAADQTIYAQGEVRAEHTVFGSDPLSGYDVLTATPGTWLGANFYTRDIPYRIGWEIVGVRIWVPLDYSGPMLAAGGYVSLNLAGNGYNNLVIGNVYLKDTPELITGLDNEAKTAFTNLQPGWNNIYFNDTYTLKHQSGFIVGYAIDGYYVGKDLGHNNEIQAADGTNLYLSSHDPEDAEPKRAEYGIPALNGYWSNLHYGLDVIVREPPADITKQHSIWSNEVIPDNAEYSYGNDIGVGGWTASNFYSYHEDGPQDGWTLVGAKLYLDQNTDPYNVLGMTGECGYYIKAAGPIDNNDDNQYIMNQIVASNTATTTLQYGWNTVYFDTPITIPWASGIAIGWKIGDGSYYTASEITATAIPAIDGSPFYLAPAFSESGLEQRGEFLIGSDGYWAYQQRHYGSDIIVKEPDT